MSTPQPAQHPSERAPPGRAAHRGGILIVDDNPANLFALRAVLEPLGLPIVAAKSGKEALQSLLQQDFALILMDVMMPELDGYETVSLIRQRDRSKEIPVVFVTAVASESKQVQKGYDYGAVDYVTKPFDPSSLRAKVRLLVDLSLRTERIVEERLLIDVRRQRLLGVAVTGSSGVEARRQYERLALVSWELRGPLDALESYKHQFRGIDVGDPVHALAEIQAIEDRLRAYQQRIDDLIEVSRIVRGELGELTMEAVDLAPIAEHAIDRLQSVASSGGVELVEQLDRAATANGDAPRLEQVVWNLVANAIRFSNRGAPVVTRLAPRDRDVELEVRDAGAGITAADLPTIFEWFWRALPPSPPGSRHGLGLAIVKHLVELHGGNVRAKSIGPGQGTTFTVTLPKRR
ncbi:MAG: hybrid sensor histidine kinase/response regulator [Polyangiaceae bacterium]|nr:hybrid sensor histidine kinase/response regulator [Polyangiaceae bacterium]